MESSSKKYSLCLVFICALSFICCDQPLLQKGARQILRRIELGNKTEVFYSLRDSSKLVHIDAPGTEPICLEISFCSQCDSWVLCPTDETGNPVSECIEDDNTGTILDPQHHSLSMEARYFSLTYSSPFCVLKALAFQDPECTFLPNRMISRIYTNMNTILT